MTDPSFLSVAAFVLNLLVLVIGGTWRLSRMEVSLSNKITRTRAEIEERQDRQSREVGETVAAVREKINQVELYCRDTFVRRDGFYKVRDELAVDIKTLGEKIEARLERMESKIDSRPKS
jgi:hypothetical protein